MDRIYSRRKGNEMNQTRVKEEAERLRNIARNLSYSEVESESIIKFVLNEVAMRLETGWYEKSDVSETNPCDHPEHNFPTMFHIPQGEIYVHTCPGCGHRIRVAG